MIQNPWLPLAWCAVAILGLAALDEVAARMIGLPLGDRLFNALAGAALALGVSFSIAAHWARLVGV